MLLFLALYLVGLVVGFVLIAIAMKHEPTSHGQAMLLGTGVAMVALWPVLLAWVAIVGLAKGGAWLVGRLKAR